jgi:asparagine synthase (glutamine-hydrolysing)
MRRDLASAEASGRASPGAGQRAAWRSAVEHLRELGAPRLHPAANRRPWRDLVEELRELGLAGVAFRVRWELALRTGWMARTERAPGRLPRAVNGDALLRRLPFAPAADVAAVMAHRLPGAARAALGRLAVDAAKGRVLCFGRWTADFGAPIDWHRNPVTGQRWNSGAHWSETLEDTGRVGDVKLTWEVGRFPHAYHLARAAVHGAVAPEVAAEILADQIASFVDANPYGRGLHWASGQEIVVRLAAWLFAVSALRDQPRIRDVLPVVAQHLHEGGVHLERHFDYVRMASNGNHLLSEAFGLQLAGTLLSDAPRSARWRELGLETLTAQAARQVYADGGYLMHSHNYERAALHMYLLAASLLRAEGRPMPEAWRAAMARAVDFLVAHQNPGDGRLPNYGNNDGALMAVLSACDYSDFRPFLQALSLAARGERIYAEGPWDEEAAWLLGKEPLEAPLRARGRRSVSFPTSGFHVLRGRREDTFSAFRCGTIRDRFTQIDMLHVDVFWRGENVLADGGTYLYSGPVEWLRHFTGGASHNTVTVDGRDQMVHHRRFKILYPTRARLLSFEDAGAFAVAEGEHDGFRRYPGRCVHRRAVLRVGDDLWVVVDTVRGDGGHTARLQWLGGPYPHRYDVPAGRLEVETPAGPFTVTVLASDARPLPGDVVAGGETPPRGWLSRYYGEKVPAPSLAVSRSGEAPLELVSVLSAGRPTIAREGARWRVNAEGCGVSFDLHQGRFSAVVVDGPPKLESR